MMKKSQNDSHSKAKGHIFLRSLCHRGSGGFTSIELLVVIVVVVMLAGLLLPTLAKVKNEAKTIGCIRNLKQMGQGSLMYAQDFNGNLTGNSWIGTVINPYSDRNGSDDDLNWLYPRYIKTLSTFICPATKNTIRDTPVANAKAPYGSYLVDLTDNATTTRTAGSSYEVFGVFNAYPAEAYGRKKNDKEVLVHEIRNYAGHLGEVPGPAKVLLVTDADDTTGFPTGGLPNPYNQWPDPGNNHGSAGTCANFADGHAEFIPLNRFLQVWNLGQDSNTTGH